MQLPLDVQNPSRQWSRALEPYDLIVATNVLVYYDPFERALALANVGTMLRPGGRLLTNSPVYATPPMTTEPGLMTVVDYDSHGNGDTLFWYRWR